jgi:hypothetical protein
MATLITPPVILSHPHLFRPQLHKLAKPGDKPKYSVASLFTHAALETEEYRALVAAMRECGNDFWGAAMFKTLVDEGSFQSPFRRDLSAKKYDSALFARFITSESGEDHPPVVLGTDHQPITDPRAIYPGVVARVSVSPRAFGGPGTSWKPGIKLDLRNVLKVADGPRLTGDGSDGSEFGPRPAAAPAGGGAGIDAATAAAMLG